MKCHLLLYLHNYLTTLQVQGLHAKCPVIIFISLIHGSFFKKYGHDNKYLAHYFHCVLLYMVRYMAAIFKLPQTKTT
jgi:hypothetical protein